MQEESITHKRGTRLHITELDPEDPNFEHHVADSWRNIKASYQEYPYVEVGDPVHVRREIAAGRLRTFLVREDNRVVGTAAMVSNGPVWEFGRLAVDPSHRGKAYGQALVWHRLSAAAGDPVYTTARAAEPATTHNIFKAFATTKGGVHILGVAPYALVNHKQEFLIEMGGNLGKASDFQHPRFTPAEWAFLGPFLKGRRTASFTHVRPSNVKIGDIVKVSEHSKYGVAEPIGNKAIRDVITAARRNSLVNFLMLRVPLRDEHLPLREALVRNGFIPSAIGPKGNYIIYGLVTKPKRKVKLGEVNLPSSFDEPHVAPVKDAIMKIVEAYHEQLA